VDEGKLKELPQRGTEEIEYPLLLDRKYFILQR